MNDYSVLACVLFSTTLGAASICIELGRGDNCSQDMLSACVHQHVVFAAGVVNRIVTERDVLTALQCMPDASDHVTDKQLCNRSSQVLANTVQMGAPRFCLPWFATSVMLDTAIWKPKAILESLM